MEKDFNLEWHEIKKENSREMLPLFLLLNPIYVEIFLPVMKPYSYIWDPSLANIENESPEKQAAAEERVNSEISEELRVGWIGIINRLYDALQNGVVRTAYLVIAKDLEQNIIGFCLFKEIDVKHHLTVRITKFIEGSLDLINSDFNVHDTIYVSDLGIRPGIQKKGLGKTLLFSIFEYCPSIKKMYLDTSPHELNKKTLGFYDHLGFKRLIRGHFIDEGEGFYGRDKIVYFYQRP